MKLFGANHLIHKGAYPLLGIALLLVVACSTAAPSARESAADETTSSAGSETGMADSADSMEHSDEVKSNGTESAGSMETSPGMESGSMEVSYTIGHEVGQRIPDFSMTLVDGSTVTSADLIGEKQPTFLFFFETW